MYNSLGKTVETTNIRKKVLRAEPSDSYEEMYTIFANPDRRWTTMGNEKYRFKLGEFECTLISDGTFEYRHPSQIFFTNAPKDRLEQPDWYSVFDLEPEDALAGKRQLMDRAAVEKTLVFIFHFSFPGLGHIIQKGEGWQRRMIKASR